jgi:hypothetical protein
MPPNDEMSFPRKPNPDSFEGKLGLKEGSSQPVFLRNGNDEFLFEYWTAGTNDKFVENESNGGQIFKTPELFIEISRVCLAFGCIGLKMRIDENNNGHFTTHFGSEGVAVDERNERIIPELCEIIERHSNIRALTMANVTFLKTP